MANLKVKVDLLNLDNVKKAYEIANNAIYFNDRSDYKTALWEVCKSLCPNIEDEEIGKEYIDLGNRTQEETK